jgi:ParB/RepB/Spo0J family partition protein
MHTTASHFDAPTSRLVPSPLNPRKTIRDIEELTDSIRSKGVLQPLLVRPSSMTKRGEAALEIVCGERRWRAAQAAGVTSVPVLLRELDDEAALEAMVVENSQRADVHPLEEADGIAALRERGRSVEEIAAKLGRPAAFVYRRLVLRQLGKKARAAYAEGQLTAAAAEMLATVPTGKLQDEALDGMKRRAWGGDPVSKRTAGDIVQHFRLELADVRWKLDDAELLPKAGACSSCPKRTGAQPALFEEVTKDHCTDPACFAEKKTAHAARAVEAAKAAGRQVLSQTEAKRVWPNNYSRTPEAGYVDLDAPSGDYGSGKKWRTVLGKRAPESTVVAVHPHTGDVHELVERDAVKRVLEAEPKKGDPTAPGAKASGSSTGVSAAEKKRAQIAKAKSAGHKAAAEELRTKLSSPHAFHEAPLDELLRLVGFAIVERVYGDVLDRCARRRGYDIAKDDPGEVMERAFAGATAESSAAMIVEVLVEERLHMMSYSDGPEGFPARVMDFMGVDWLAHEQAAIAALEERLEKKVAKKKSSKKKAAKKARAK